MYVYIYTCTYMCMYSRSWQRYRIRDVDGKRRDQSKRKRAKHRDQIQLPSATPSSRRWRKICVDEITGQIDELLE